MISVMFWFLDCCLGEITILLMFPLAIGTCNGLYFFSFLSFFICFIVIRINGVIDNAKKKYSLIHSSIVESSPKTRATGQADFFPAKIINCLFVSHVHLFWQRYAENKTKLNSSHLYLNTNLKAIIQEVWSSKFYFVFPKHG